MWAKRNKRSSQRSKEIQPRADSCGWRGKGENSLRGRARLAVAILTDTAVRRDCKSQLRLTSVSFSSALWGESRTRVCLWVDDGLCGDPWPPRQAFEHATHGTGRSRKRCFPSSPSSNSLDHENDSFQSCQDAPWVMSTPKHCGSCQCSSQVKSTRGGSRWRSIFGKGAEEM